MEYAFEGLTIQEVEQSREKHGSNNITPQDVETFWDKLKDNFKDPMIVILVVALVIVSVLAVMGFAEWYEGLGIAVAVALATLVATASEHKNEQTFQKLQEEASKINVNVFRERHLRSVGIDDIVVGDRVLLQPGDKVPADGKVVSGEIKVNQAMFTGEAESILKKTGDPAGDLHNLDDPHFLFRGTTVEDGEAVMQVEVIGDRTLFGKLSRELEAEDREGPLRVKLGKLAQDIATFGYIAGTLIALAFIFKVILMDHQFKLDLILIYLSNWQQVLYDVATAAILAVIIIVVAVPEGLPMMVAIVLAQNMKKLLTSNVLVRQLLGIETAGSLNVLFCDKTGTITKGRLEAVNFISAAGQKYADYQKIPSKLKDILDLSLRENTSCVINPSAERKSECLIGGNVTERALLQYIQADSAPACYLGENLRVVKEILFNPVRKFSASQIEGDYNMTLVKGVPEKILENCSSYYDSEGAIKTFSDSEKEELSNEINDQSKMGLRIVAIATSNEALEDDGHLPMNLQLAGFISIRDELRSESKTAIDTIHNAGVQVVMVTGDKMGTAQAIANDVGLLSSPQDAVFESSEMEALSDEALKSMLPNLKIIARSRPEEKKRLVRLAQDAGLVIGMTGDGINDAPALRSSDIGFGMGSGSEVAKEASEIVILDDNIHSISNAIHYGRTIYRSIQKFITFQLTVNVSAILVAFLGPFLGYRLPLTMIQLLWVNLIMDTLAALAFSGEPALAKHMVEKPKDREENIISRDMWSSILLNGLFIAALSVFFLKSGYIRPLFHSEGAFLTAFFALFVFLNNFNKFNVRVEEMNLFDHIFENRGFLRIVGLIFVVQIILTYFGGDVFRTVPLQPKEWVYITFFAIAIIPFDLTRKFIRDLVTVKPTG